MEPGIVIVEISFKPLYIKNTLVPRRIVAIVQLANQTHSLNTAWFTSKLIDRTASKKKNS
jgi:hypothetical protein